MIAVKRYLLEYMNPTPEDFHVALNAFLHDKMVLSWWQLLVFVVVAGVAAYFGSYLKKRGENLATKEDIGVLTRSVESIKTENAKEIEKYKDNLLRKKIIFEEQLTAYNKLRRFLYVIRPEKKHPEQEWDEALADIALNFKTHGKELREYLIEYSGVLPEDVRGSMESCYYACEEGKFYTAYPGDDPEAEKIANQLWSKLEKAEEDFAKYLEIRK